MVLLRGKQGNGSIRNFWLLAAESKRWLTLRSTARQSSGFRTTQLDSRVVFLRYVDGSITSLSSVVLVLLKPQLHERPKCIVVLLYNCCKRLACPTVTHQHHFSRNIRQNKNQLLCRSWDRFPKRKLGLSRLVPSDPDVDCKFIITSTRWMFTWLCVLSIDIVPKTISRVSAIACALLPLSETHLRN